MRILLSLALVLSSISPVLAGKYYGLYKSAANEASMNLSGDLCIAASALTPTVCTITLDGPTGVITGDGSGLVNVSGAGIAPGSITSDKLADDAVTTPKINDASVTSAKISWPMGAPYGSVGNASYGFEGAFPGAGMSAICLEASCYLPILTDSFGNYIGMKSGNILLSNGGSAASPALRLVGGNEGIYLGADTLNFTTQGVSSVMWLDSSQQLNLTNSIKIADGTETSGYVLTSDGSGEGTWQPAGASAIKAWKAVYTNSWISQTAATARNFTVTGDDYEFLINATQLVSDGPMSISLGGFAGAAHSGVIHAAESINIGAGGIMLPLNGLASVMMTGANGSPWCKASHPMFARGTLSRDPSNSNKAVITFQSFCQEAAGAGTGKWVYNGSIYYAGASPWNTISFKGGAGNWTGRIEILELKN